MTVVTTKDNLLIGEIVYPIGSKVDVEDGRGRLLLERKAARPFVEVAMARPPETADLPHAGPKGSAPQRAAR